MPGRASPAQALAAACAVAGLDAAGAKILHDRANTVFKLAGQPLVARLRYTRGSPAWMDKLTASVRITAWLHDLGFPTVQPAGLAQPTPACGYLVTFWHHLPRDPGTPGRRQFPRSAAPRPAPARPGPAGHAARRQPARLTARRHPAVRLAPRPAAVVAACPLRRAPAAVRHDHVDPGLRPDPRRRLRREPHPHPPRARPRRLGLGQPRPPRTRHRPHQHPAPVRRPPGEWDQFCAAYGINPDDLPGLAVLREMRELRTLVPYLRSTGKPAAQAEATRRIHDLMTGDQTQPWHALNLVS